MLRFDVRFDVRFVGRFDVRFNKRIDARFDPIVETSKMHCKTRQIRKRKITHTKSACVFIKKPSDMYILGLRKQV